MFVNRKLTHTKIGDYIVYIILGLLFVFFAALLYNKGFLTLGNLMNIIRQASTVAIMAVGMTFVLSAGEIDLSIGSNVALSALVTAILIRDYNIYLGILGGICVGVIIGLINGLLIANAKIPSFLVTLGMMSILLGFARWISHLSSISVTSKTFNFIFGGGNIGKVPVLLIWLIFALVFGELALKKTPFGRKVLATGGNKIAAIYTGIKVDRIKLAVMVISGVAAALAGMIYAGRLQGARYTLGEADLLTVIAATIVGGTSLSGGKGTVIGAVVGAIIITMINNGLILLGLSLDQQIISRGIIIIAAVAFGTKED